LFNKEFQFGRMKNVLEMDGGCGCITIWARDLKWLKMVNFIYNLPL
jgi:hypothetical protein